MFLSVNKAILNINLNAHFSKGNEERNKEQNTYIPKSNHSKICMILDSNHDICTSLYPAMFM